MKIREMTSGDCAAVVDLLVEGFPSRNADYWRTSLHKIQSQIVPIGQPQLGFVMEEAGALVGVLLMLWTPPDLLKKGQMRANLSSWYVQPPYRGYAAMLLAKACRDPNVTYLNVSPADHTVKICEMMGFKQYSAGQSVCLPILSRFKIANRVFQYGTEKSQLSPMLDKLVEAHVSMGCLALVGESHGHQTPFLFVRRRVQGVVPAWQLVYAENVGEFAEFSCALGWLLLKKGTPLVICDGNGNPGKMLAKFISGKVPKYYKGPDRPEISDLAFTEIVVFGI